MNPVVGFSKRGKMKGEEPAHGFNAVLGKRITCYGYEKGKTPAL